MNTEDIQEKARQTASQKAKAKTKKVMANAEDKNLTTYEDLVSDYETSIFVTSSGRTFEIQPISPGAYFLITGSPLLDILTEKGLDNEDIETRRKAFEELSDDEKMAIVTNDDYLEFMQRVCCAGIISLNFVMKRQSACRAYKKEVSIDLLSSGEGAGDLVELFGAIMELSSSESEGEMVETFRKEDKEESTGHDTDTSDGEGVSPDAV